MIVLIKQVVDRLAEVLKIGFSMATKRKSQWHIPSRRGGRAETWLFVAEEDALKLDDVSNAFRQIPWEM